MTVSEKMDSMRAGLEALLAAVHADDPKREILVRVGDLMREAKSFTAALSDQVVVAEPYLVWSNQHRAWWRANSRGYTMDVRAAGHYSRDEAISISGQVRDGWLEPKKAPDEFAIPLSALPKNIRAMIAAAPASTAGEVGK